LLEQVGQVGGQRRSDGEDHSENHE
jgi:hypothetical protein